MDSKYNFAFKVYPMKSLFKKLVFLFLILNISFSVVAQINFTAIDSLLKDGNAKHVFSGIVLIAKENNILFEKSYGYADFKTNKPFTKNTTFQIASVSKQFTAFAIMQLAAKKRLGYLDKVNKFIPNFPYSNITIQHLLHHTSGLPNFWDTIRPFLNQNISNGNKEMLLYLIDKKLPLQFEPGSKWQYADIGYDLLALIIENISGISYKKYLNRNVIKPSALKNTKALMVTDIRKIKDENLAYGHSWLKDSNYYEYAHLLPKNDFVFYLGNFYGDGSVTSSAKDLLKWSTVLASYALLDSIKMSKAFFPMRDNNDSIIYTSSTNKLMPTYGYGWGIANQANVGKMYYHSGGHPGFTSYFLRCPDKRLTFIFLCNISNTNELNELRKTLLEYIYAGYK
jgi:CubicO group peptidase (beta-lactamase class C family)